MDRKYRKFNLPILGKIQKSIVDECRQEVPQSGPGQHVGRIMPLCLDPRPGDAGGKAMLPALIAGLSDSGMRIESRLR